MSQWLILLAILRLLPAPGELVAEVIKLGIELDPGDLERLGSYMAMLLHANQYMNLTAVTDPDELWTRHVLDSLSLVPFIASVQARTVIDVGSGGGLPGLALALVLPEIKFTLLEATAKKARFLEEAARLLKLVNTVVVNDRAESIGVDREHHREKYDVVTARAVGRLPVLLELTIPLAVVGGYALAIKGARAQEEIDSARTALHLLHCRVSDIVATPTGTIVVIEKQRRTPKIYPRRPGEPKRAPLGGKMVADANAEDCGGK